MPRSRRSPAERATCLTCCRCSPAFSTWRRRSKVQEAIAAPAPSTAPGPTRATSPSMASTTTTRSAARVQRRAARQPRTPSRNSASPPAARTPMPAVPPAPRSAWSPSPEPTSSTAPPTSIIAPPFTVANDWFNKKAQVDTGQPNIPGKLIRNIFGADVGGPIIKDKLFFFGNYEGQRTAENKQVTRTTPTAAYQAGQPSTRTPMGTRQSLSADAISPSSTRAARSATHPPIPTLRGQPERPGFLQFHAGCQRNGGGRRRIQLRFVHLLVTGARSPEHQHRPLRLRHQ